MIKINPNAKKNVCCNCNKAFEIGVDLDLNGKFINKPKLCLECLTNLFLEIKQYMPQTSKKRRSKK